MRTRFRRGGEFRQRRQIGTAASLLFRYVLCCRCSANLVCTVPSAASSEERKRRRHRGNAAAENWRYIDIAVPVDDGCLCYWWIAWDRPAAVVAGNCGRSLSFLSQRRCLLLRLPQPMLLADVTMLTVFSQPDAVITADAVIFPTCMLGEMESSATIPTGALTGPLTTIPDALVVPVPVLGGALSRSTICCGPDTPSLRPSGPCGLRQSSHTRRYRRIRNAAFLDMTIEMFASCRIE